MYDGKQLRPASVAKDKLALVDPTAALDPTTKQWVEALITQSIYNKDWKDNARAAQNTNVNLASPGATIGGVTMSTGDSFVAWGQTTASQNGIYTWNGAVTPAARRTDADSNSEFTSQLVVTISEGTFAGKTLRVTTADPIVLGTTAITFDYFVTLVSSTPSVSNKNMACVVTTNDGDVACNTGISGTPYNDSFVKVEVSGVDVEVGDGVKTKDSYFSGDSGTTARAWIDITSGDKLYWNGSVAGYQLNNTTDKISFYYNI